MRTRIAVILGLLLILAFGDVPERTRFWRALVNLGHVPLFGFLALSLLSVVRRSRPQWSSASHSLGAFIGAVGIGLAAEALQALTPNREASLQDIARNVAGALAFLVAGAVRDNRHEWARGRLGLAIGAAALLVAVAAGEFARAVAVDVALARAMPTLARLDGSWWERDVVTPTAATLTPADPGHLARLVLEPGTYPGLTLDELYPDWRGFRLLELTIVSDREAPLAMSIRVNDAAHDNRHADRFNRSLVIARGVNHVRIPLDEIRRAPDTRTMDMARIRTVILFAPGLVQPVELRLGPWP